MKAMGNHVIHFIPGGIKAKEPAFRQIIIIIMVQLLFPSANFMVGLLHWFLSSPFPVSHHVFATCALSMTKNLPVFFSLAFIC